MYNLLKEGIYWRILGEAMLSLLPIFVGYLLFGNIMFFNVGLVTISLFIGANRLNLGMYAVTLHFFLIFLFFSLLFFSFSVPYMFVALCSTMAFFTIYCTQHGAKLRTLANYTFIPTVYLACELHENVTKALAQTTYLKFVTLMPIAWLSIFGLYAFTKFVHTKAERYYSKKKTLLQRILQGAELGEPENAWIQPAIAIFLGVAIAASIVIFFNISRGEWVIWSVASVITIELSSSRKKLHERLLGVVIGVPLGFFVAQFVPKTEIVYSLAALGIMLTLVAFKRYQIAFVCRCFFISLAAYVASSTPEIAIERISNVVLGGMIGIAAIYLTQVSFKLLFKASR